MYCVSVGASFRLRCGVVGLLAAALLLSLASDADARSRKRGFFKRYAAAASYSPRYADIVVDANSGDVLHDASADSQRHPASLTKVMTLYLLFERLEAGKLRLDSRLSVSENATEQAPSKLGVREGQTISVEDAIKALVTKSANDVAVVIAETIAGSEQEFAALMTRKARALGMSRTVYKNASGLPDDEQVTTARDQALLAMAVQDRFPKYYRYFSTSAFAWGGRPIRNHNRLLGRVDGVDGIKTGYTRASGFNLITSVRRGKRHIVAVVFGGASAGARDARMRDLIATYVSEGAQNRTAPKVAEKTEPAETRPAKTRVASADPAVPAVKETKAPDQVTTATVPMPRPAPPAGSTDPIKPNLVKTVSVKAGAAQTQFVAPLSLLSPQLVATQIQPAPAPARREVAELPPAPPGARPGVLGVLPASGRDIAAVTKAPAAKTYAVASAEAAPVPAPVPAPVASAEFKHRVGWMIQVGAFEDEKEAKERLASARSKAARLLEGSDPFTETVVKGSKTLYRARFAGFKQEQAEAACKHLKRSDMVCMALKVE
jgi:D-alanyl-D-alanine carboxypeptidase